MSELDDAQQEFGSARRPQRPPAHVRPAGLDDDTVDALGRLSAALEVAEDARGHLYAFHRLSGSADLHLQDAVRALRDSGHVEVARTIDDMLVGRDVVRDMWTFEIVEAYDEQYMEVFRRLEAAARADLDAGPKHVFEAEMKHRAQQSGSMPE